MRYTAAVKSAWILATLAALAGGAWWWRGRERAAPRGSAAVATVTTAPDASAPPPIALDAAAAPAPTVTPAVAGTPAPSQPGPDPVAMPGAGTEPFEREVRDPGWAVDQEHELLVRLAHVAELVATRGAKVTITAAECRATTCRITVDAAGAQDLSALYGALETTDGLYGWADAIVLGQVDTDATTGAMTTAVTAVFERDPT